MDGEDACAPHKDNKSSSLSECECREPHGIISGISSEADKEEEPELVLRVSLIGVNA